MIPAVHGGLAATVADDGVAAMTTTSRLRAAVAERVMATVAGSGVMATVAGSGVAVTTATSRLRAATAERAMALAFDGGVAATAADNSCRRAPAAERVVGVPRTPKGMPCALHYAGDCAGAAV